MRSGERKTTTTISHNSSRMVVVRYRERREENSYQNRENNEKNKTERYSLNTCACVCIILVLWRSSRFSLLSSSPHSFFLFVSPLVVSFVTVLIFQKEICLFWIRLSLSLPMIQPFYHLISVTFSACKVR